MIIYELMTTTKYLTFYKNFEEQALQTITNQSLSEIAIIKKQ